MGLTVSRRSRQKLKNWNILKFRATKYYEICCEDFLCPTFCISRYQGRPRLLGVGVASLLLRKVSETKQAFIKTLFH